MADQPLSDPDSHILPASPVLSEAITSRVDNACYVPSKQDNLSESHSTESSSSDDIVPSTPENYLSDSTSSDDSSSDDDHTDTKTNRTPLPTKAFNFLQLPEELRSIIYKELFNNQTSFCNGHHPQILATCKFIHAEAAPLFTTYDVIPTWVTWDVEIAKRYRETGVQPATSIAEILTPDRITEISRLHQSHPPPLSPFRCLPPPISGCKTLVVQIYRTNPLIVNCCTFSCGPDRPDLARSNWYDDKHAYDLKWLLRGMLSGNRALQKIIITLKPQEDLARIKAACDFRDHLIQWLKKAESTYEKKFDVPGGVDVVTFQGPRWYWPR